MQVPGALFVYELLLQLIREAKDVIAIRMRATTVEPFALASVRRTSANFNPRMENVPSLG